MLKPFTTQERPSDTPGDAVVVTRHADIHQLTTSHSRGTVPLLNIALQTYDADALPITGGTKYR
jgi:hypothetical protein